ncbi:MAG: adenylate/guanylate cyclase domain-containing protein [Hyphomicrobiales bacterium]|nr:adenylate/guanylate cyclase domain-containing protein [Hyphomicrobiales bacterium]
MISKENDGVIEKVSQPAGIQRAFAETERRSEVIAAVSRILIAGTLLLAAWLAQSAGPAGHALIAVGVIYSLISVIGLVLVMANIYHPVFPYLSVFVDSAAVAAALTMQARMHNLELAHEFSLPIFSLAFVVLIHAALRYRAGIVVFGAGTLVALLFVFPFLFGPMFDVHHGPVSIDGEASAGTQISFLHDIGYMPLLFLGLAVMLLFFIVRRTRGLAHLALLDGQRAAQLSRFFSPEVASRLAREGGTTSSSRRQSVAVLFIDIRGFTRLSEGMAPDELAELLSSFRNSVCQVVFDHGGTVDKFIGDAILVVFGTPESHDDDAHRAIQAVFKISHEVREWYDRRQADGLPAAQVGIGAHYGEVFAGVIETGQILEHSVIGDAVNVAQRLERLTRDLDCRVVISEELMQAADAAGGDLHLKRKENVHITGHAAPVTIFYDKPSAR